MEKTIGIVYAPIEIQNPGQLETLGITWKDVVPLRIGGKIVSVYLVPASEEVSSYLYRELRNKYTQERREQRCGVPNAKGRLVYCPESASCSTCPCREAEEAKRPRTLSLEAIFEDGWDCESNDADLQEKAELRDLLSSVGKANPLTLRVLDLYLGGYTILEIAEILDMSKSTVHRHLMRARVIAGCYGKGE